jgi:hypothetical protein
MKDPFLEFLALMANDDPTGCSGVMITLCVSGTIISGEVISSKKFFETISKDYRTCPKELSWKFIHLNKCRIFHGKFIVPESEGYEIWRGRIDSIDGFFLGELAEIKKKRKSN